MKVANLLENILVINLDKDKDRLENIYKQFPNAQRVPAIYGKELPNLKELAVKMNAPSTDIPATIGCGLSHKKAWQTILNNGWDYGLILEDDTTLNDSSENAKDVELPDDWDVIFLGHCKKQWPRNECSRVSTPMYEDDAIFNDRWFKFKTYENAPMGAWGYVLTAKSARYLIDNYNLEEPIDVRLIYDKTLQKLQTYGLNPSIITHCFDFGSYTSPIKPKKLLYKYKNENKVYIAFLAISSIACLFLTVINKYFYILLAVLIALMIRTFKTTSIPLITIIKPKTQCYTFGKDKFDPFANVWNADDKKLLTDLLRRLMKISISANINCVLMAGSLLGWARHNKDIIPWDDDLDVSTHKDNISILRKAFEKDPELNVLFRNGYIKISWENQGTPIDGYSYSYPFIDIFPYELKDDSIKVLSKTIKLDKPFKTVTDSFIGVNVNVPVEYPKILDGLYGVNWSDTCISSNWNHKNECEIDPRFISKIKCSLL